MSKFNVGDVVVRTWNILPDLKEYKCVTGKPVTITSCDLYGNLSFSEEEGGHGWFSDYFSKYEPKFDLKTMPWKIIVNSPEESRMAQEWLRENGLNWPCGGGAISCVNSPILTNCEKGSLNAAAYYMHSGSNDGRDIAPEIKLTFGITSVEYPPALVQETKTEAQKKMKELEDKQREIAEELAKLRESM